MFDTRIATIAILTIFSACPSIAKNLIFLDNSVSNDTYIPSNKEAQINQAFKLAVADLKFKYPQCNIKSDVMIERSSLLNVMKQVDVVSEKYDPRNSVIVGLIHSSEAVLAGKSFAKTKFTLVSSGATTENLGIANSRLFSLANNVGSFTKSIDEFLKLKKVHKLTILVPGNSSYAVEFATSLKKRSDSIGVKSTSVTVDPANIEDVVSKQIKDINAADAIFLPGFIQQSLPILAVLQKHKFAGIAVGTPNWGRSIPDLNTLGLKLNLSTKNVFLPISWQQGESEESELFEDRFLKSFKSSPMGTAVYTFDATILAGAFLCTHSDLTKFKFSDFVRNGSRKIEPKTVRDYSGESAGHLDSKVSVIPLSSVFKGAPHD